jgi:hypothetical protein
MEMLHLKKLNEVEGKEKYRVEIPNRSADLKDLASENEINSAWEVIEEISKFQTKRV